MAATGQPKVSDTRRNGAEHGSRDAAAVEPEKALAARERLRAAAAAARQRRQQQQSAETTTDTSSSAAAATTDTTGRRTGGVEAAARSDGSGRAVEQGPCDAGRAAASGASTPGEDGAEGDSLLAMLGVRVARQEEMETVLGQRLDADAAQRETLLRADRARIHLQVSHPSLVPPATQDTRPKPHAGNGRERRKV